MFNVFITALHEKIPIIVSSNIVSNFCFLKNHYKKLLTIVKDAALNLKEIDLIRKELSQLADDYSIIKQFLNFDQAVDFLLSLCFATINQKTWDCYCHTTQLIIFIPKSHPMNNHIDINILKKINLSSLAQLKELIKNDNKCNNAVLNEIITVLTSLNKNRLPWNIYLTGHGQSGKKKDDYIIRYTAKLAGLHYSNFQKLLIFLNKKIKTFFFHYSTCCAGGSNQIFIQNILKNKAIKYIVSTEGINEMTVRSQVPQMIFSQKKNRFILSYPSFKTFFLMLKLFFLNRPLFYKQYENMLPQQEPIAKILHTIINTDDIYYSAPSIYLPDGLTKNFTYVAAEEKTYVLTESITQECFLNKECIDLTNLPIRLIIINPSYIPITLKINRNHCVAFLISQKVALTQSKNVSYVFEKILFKSTLPNLIANIIALNESFYTTTIIIKKLFCANYQNSHLNDNYNTPNRLLIKNMIIQLTHTSLSDTAINVYFDHDSIAFRMPHFTINLKDNDYQEDILLNYYQKHNPIVAYLHHIAKKVLPIEIDTIKSLDTIIDYFQEKINTEAIIDRSNSLKDLLFTQKPHGTIMPFLPQFQWNQHLSSEKESPSLPLLESLTKS